MMARLILVNILLLFSLDLLANSCPSIRLDSKNHSMEHVKVTSQDGLGVCYAYAATQMLDAVFDTEDKYFKREIDKKTSSSLFSAVVALDHYKNSGNVVLRDNGNYRFPFEGGQICDSFNFIKGIGACPDDRIQKYLQVIRDDQGKRILDVSTPYKFFAEIYKVFDEYSKSTKTQNLKPSPIIDFLLNKQSPSLSCYKDSLENLRLKLKMIFGADAPSDLLLHIAFNSAQGPIAVFGSFMMNLCPENVRRKPLIPVTCQDVSSRSFYMRNEVATHKFSREILKQLSSFRQPVGISYCSKMLSKGKNYIGVKSHSNGTYRDDCGHHASVAIGSRMKNGQCEILVRNSWGSGCGTYHKDFECEKGNIWIPAKTMENNVYKFSKLKVGI